MSRLKDTDVRSRRHVRRVRVGASDVMAFHTLLDVRGPSTGGSDFSPGPFAPLMAIQGMVTRTGWDNATWGDTQRISIDDALKVTTLNRAYASHDEGVKGSISVGLPSGSLED